MTSWIPALATDKPRYVAIADAIAADLSAGKLKAGDRLPPQRELAWKLGVTHGTVTRAYQEAEKRGLLVGEVGRGSYLRTPETAAPIYPHAPDPLLLDLQVSSPPRVLSHGDLQSALDEIAKDANWQELLDYPPTAGRIEQRATCAAWLRPTGIEVDASRIVLAAGAQASLITTFSTLARPGDRILIEPLTYPTVQPIIQHLGMQTRALQADAEGIIPESLDHLARSGDARLIYLVPTLQNPTTTTLSAGRRKEIAEIARRHDLIIIEDDVFRLLADNPPPTLYSMAPERTYYISSLSKTVAPGLRIGILVTPEGSTDALVRQQMVTGGRAAAMSAELARRWIQSGVAERARAGIKRELAVRRSIALDILGRHEFNCAPGAMFVWLSLPPHRNPIEFAAMAQARGVKVTPGGAFAVDRKTPHNAVRVCIGPAPTHERLRHGLAIIDQLVDEEPAQHYQTIA